MISFLIRAFVNNITRLPIAILMIIVIVTLDEGGSATKYRESGKRQRTEETRKAPYGRDTFGTTGVPIAEYKKTSKGRPNAAGSKPADRKLSTAERALFTAIYGRKPEDVRKAAAAVSDMNFFNSAGFTPLGTAIYSENIDIVTIVLDRGADPNFRDASGKTPLDYTVYKKSRGKICELLLKRGADPNALNPDGRPPLYTAIILNNTPCVTALIRHGASMTAGNTRMDKPIHAANISRYDIASGLDSNELLIPAANGSYTVQRVDRFYQTGGTESEKSINSSTTGTIQIAPFVFLDEKSLDTLRKAHEKYEAELKSRGSKDERKMNEPLIPGGNIRMGGKNIHVYMDDEGLRIIQKGVDEYEAKLKAGKQAASEKVVIGAETPEDSTREVSKIIIGADEKGAVSPSSTVEIHTPYMKIYGIPPVEIPGK